MANLKFTKLDFELTNDELWLILNMCVDAITNCVGKTHYKLYPHTFYQNMSVEINLGRQIGSLYGRQDMIDNAIAKYELWTKSTKQADEVG